MSRDESRHRIAIVGGGFAGASLAIQLVRGARRPLDITIIEPKPEIGRGLAYSTEDPDHRLNAPAYAHSVLPEDFLHFSRWAQDRGLLGRDPEALQPDGGVYFRRSDFGSYIAETLAEHSDWAATGSRISHRRGVAVDASFEGAAARVRTQDGDEIAADRIVIATGNPTPRLPASITRPWASHPGLIENPFEPGRLEAVATDAEILVVGAGLTALDALSTLLARGHRGAITAVSRHGLTPRGQAPIAPMLQQGAPPPAPPGSTFLSRLTGPIPDFLDPAFGIPPNALAWLRALRRRIAEVEAAGGTWHQPFDSLRDSLWRLWPSLPLREQRRVLKRLRTMYDV
ncbi:MAG TPA: FAD/NAD(P)-binding protein, partial [Phenylobacterium sp.]|nr:FAD/NAD(P)-binding protein [Phenylobacterium sp.]